MHLVRICAIAERLVSGQDLLALSNVDEAAMACIPLRTAVLGGS